MTRDNAAQYLPLVEALRDGELQWICNDGVWATVSPHDDVAFDEAPSFYRRRPKVREWWLLITPSGEIKASRMSITASSNGYEAVHVREVLP